MSDETLSEELVESFEIMTTDWFPGTVTPEHYGLYEWMQPYKNFWEFPKRSSGLIRWTENGWVSPEGKAIDFNAEQDMWRGVVKPAD